MSGSSSGGLWDPSSIGKPFLLTLASLHREDGTGMGPATCLAILDGWDGPWSVRLRDILRLDGRYSSFARADTESWPVGGREVQMGFVIDLQRRSNRERARCNEEDDLSSLEDYRVEIITEHFIRHDRILEYRRWLHAYEVRRDR